MKKKCSFIINDICQSVNSIICVLSVGGRAQNLEVIVFLLVYSYSVFHLFNFIWLGTVNWFTKTRNFQSVSFILKCKNSERFTKKVFSSEMEFVAFGEFLLKRFD